MARKTKRKRVWPWKDKGGGWRHPKTSYSITSEAAQGFRKRRKAALKGRTKTKGTAKTTRKAERFQKQKAEIIRIFKRHGFKDARARFREERFGGTKAQAARAAKIRARCVHTYTIEHPRHSAQNLVEYVEGVLSDVMSALLKTYRRQAQIFVKFFSSDDKSVNWVTLASTQARFASEHASSEARVIATRARGVRRGAPGYIHNSEIVGAGFRLECPTWREKQKRKRT